MKEHQSIIAMVARAVAGTADSLIAEHGRQKIFGYALGTDDDVRTIFHVACTTDWVAAEEASPEARYVFTDWPDADAAQPPAFGEIGQLLQELADRDYPEVGWGEARDQRFDAILTGLLQCRQRGLFDPSTLLIVGSTDPGPHLEKLEAEAITRLNDAKLSAPYIDFLRRYSG